MIIDCVSDLHGEYPELEGGDLLIIAGDLTTNDTQSAWKQFNEWSIEQGSKYRKVIIVAGNHDNALQRKQYSIAWPDNDGRWEYLEDEYTLFNGLKIWGSPWTYHFHGMNEHCMAFVKWTDEELDHQWRLIPHDTDILITHSPPYGIFDENKHREHCGNKSLLIRTTLLKPKLHVFGHIHEGYGHQTIVWQGKATQFVNASLMNGDYEFVNKPIRVIL